MTGESRILAIRRKVEARLEELGMSKSDLFTRSSVKSSTYYEMWDRGSLTVESLLSMADALDKPAADLLPDEHRGEVLRRKPGDRPYVEDRLELLEREVRSLRNELKKR